MMTHTGNPKTQEAEAGELIIQGNLGYTVSTSPPWAT